MSRRTALFGGTFDPPHLAHLALARAARDQLPVAQVAWVPSGEPWQKADRVVTPAAQRLAMVRLLVAGEPGMVVDDVELKRDGPSYTLDTLRAWCARPDATRPVLLLGADQAQRLTTWHRWEDVLHLCDLALAARAGQAAQLSPPAQAVLAQAGGVLHRIEMPRLDLSSTALRAQVALGEDIAPFVGEEVARYIGRNHLYLGS